MTQFLEDLAITEPARAIVAKPTLVSSVANRLARELVKMSTENTQLRKALGEVGLEGCQECKSAEYAIKALANID